MEKTDTSRTNKLKMLSPSKTKTAIFNSILFYRVRQLLVHEARTQCYHVPDQLINKLVE